MFVAVIWHFWIGLVLAVAAVATVGGLAAKYLFTVSNKRYNSDPDQEL